MVTIEEGDLIESVSDALQFISYYHPMDYIRALGDAYQAEQGAAAKDAIAVRGAVGTLGGNIGQGGHGVSSIGWESVLHG